MTYYHPLAINLIMHRPRKDSDVCTLQSDSCARAPIEDLGDGCNDVKPIERCLDTLHKHYWEHGSTDLDRSSLSLCVHANPMSVPMDDNVVLHYGTDPLVGFHLATAFVPLASKLPLPPSPDTVTVPSTACGGLGNPLLLSQWTQLSCSKSGFATVQYIPGLVAPSGLKNHIFPSPLARLPI